MQEISYFNGNMWMSEDRYNEIFGKKVLDNNQNQNGWQNQATWSCEDETWE